MFILTNQEVHTEGAIYTIDVLVTHINGAGATCGVGIISPTWTVPVLYFENTNTWQHRCLTYINKYDNMEAALGYEELSYDGKK